MARYQELPDRSGSNAVCVCAVVPDLTMCQNNAISFECTINAGAIGKSRLDVYGNCQCTWTVPSGVTRIFVEMWGAGSGGAGQANCCCCNLGIPGNGGAYAAATICTAPGCSYNICAGAGGSHGCGPCTAYVTCGYSSYMTGYNLSNFCAGPGQGVCNPCNACDADCRGMNRCNETSYACGTGSTYANNMVLACGEGSHIFGSPAGCRGDSISGSAPMGGGAGVWTTYNHCCPHYSYTASGGQFPGGGGAGAHMTCCCGVCTCGGCGASGLVRVWF